MKLKEMIPAVPFLNAVKTCPGEVFFRTPEGDRLNLKSLLSEYIFIGILENPLLRNAGEICCENDADYALLEEYLIQSAQKELQL